MIIRTKTEYIDIETGEIMKYEEVGAYHYKIHDKQLIKTKNEKFNQTIITERQLIEILGRKAIQQELF